MRPLPGKSRTFNNPASRHTARTSCRGIDPEIMPALRPKNAKITNPIQEAHNGDEAIAYLQGEPPFDDRTRFPLPAVMLLDLNMPMRNGFEVLEWLL